MECIMNFSLVFSNSDSDCCGLHPIDLDAVHWYDKPHHLWRKVTPNDVHIETLTHSRPTSKHVSTLQSLQTELKTVPLIGSPCRDFLRDRQWGRPVGSAESLQSMISLQVD